MTVNTVSINKRQGYTEVIHNGFEYHLGEKPLITIDTATGSGIFMSGFGFMICFSSSDTVIIEDLTAPKSARQIVDMLFNQVFNNTK